MDRVARFLDDIDDVTGLAFSAVSYTGLVALACALGLVLSATLLLGLPGMVLSLFACGIVMALSSAF